MDSSEDPTPMRPMSDLEPLVCIDCVAVVEPTSDDAEGWVIAANSTAEGDDHDDTQWKCPSCATASDEFLGDPVRIVSESVREDEA